MKSFDAAALAEALRSLQAMQKRVEIAKKGKEELTAVIEKHLEEESTETVKACREFSDSFRVDSFHLK
jgi:hypothetical protein